MWVFAATELTHGMTPIEYESATALRERPATRGLVSVIIPCHNVERWLAEAVQSCLDQTYPSLEVVVVDDGSTDGSPEILRAFGPKVRWESGPHRGGNAARNRGFQISSGEYVQFLDADDYLLPEKFEQQVQFLRETGAGAVYGDWRFRTDRDGRASELSDIVRPGAQEDLLLSLLSGWWVANMTLLFTRETVAATGDWDESLTAVQDKDFVLRAVIAGTRAEYQPGCHSIYRKYGNVTVSSSSKTRWLENNERILDKSEQRLTELGALAPRYRRALADAYFSMAREYHDINRDAIPIAAEEDAGRGAGFPAEGSRLYTLVHWLCGFSAAERLASLKRKARTPSAGRAGPP